MTKYRSTMPMLLGLCLVGSTLAATPASAALGPTVTVFDGDYTGAMNVTTPGVPVDGPYSDSACVERRPVTMLILTATSTSNMPIGWGTCCIIAASSTPVARWTYITRTMTGTVPSWRDRSVTTC